MRKALSVMALFVIGLLTLSMVSALNADNLVIKSVEVNGHEVNFAAGELLAVEEGEVLDVVVGLTAGSNGAEDFEVEVEISGYEYNDYDNLEDTYHVSNIQPGNTKYFNLEVQMPKQLEKDEYLLRVRVMDKNTAAVTQNVRLSVEPTRHGVSIADVEFNPGTTVKAGRSLATTVLLENYGDNVEEDVKVTVEMPALGVKATEFVDVVPGADYHNDNADSWDHNIAREDVPDMFFQVPPTAAAGDYEVKVTIKYDDLRETVSKSYTVHVVENEMFQTSDKLVLAVGPEMQSVKAGQTATYAVALTNAGAQSRAFVLTPSAGDWAAVSVSDSLVVLEPGKNQVVYVDVVVSADATAGAHVASLAVKSGSEVLETVQFGATVVPGQEEQTTGSNFSLRNGLEVALIVLVVLLVIVGLIIGFSRLRKDDEEDSTYY